MKKQTKIRQTAGRALRCLVALGTAGLCLPALAQDGEELESGEPVPAAEQGAKQPVLQLSTGGSQQFKTDIDHGGDMAISRFRIGVGVPMHLNEKWSLNTSFKYELDSYDFSGGVNPWHNINTLSGLALLQYRLGERWLMYGGPIMRMSAESGADWGKATQGGGALAVNYIASEKLSIGGGIVALSQIEDDALVMPILTANWKFADKWKAALGFTDLATSGYGANVSWLCHENWQLTFGGQFHKARFRIDGSGASNDGVGEDSAFVLTTAATWTPNKSFTGTAFVGLATGGQVRLENSNGHKIADEDYDPAAIIGLKLGFLF